MQKCAGLSICVIMLLIQVVNITMSTPQCHAAPTADGQRNGVLWQIPASVKPDMTLAHPRVQYTVAGLQQAKERVAREAWAKMVLQNLQQQASLVPISDAQIRAYMPPQYAYFKYTDTMVPCPDGSPMTASWDKPGQVTCGRNVFPNATHPDDGRGWRDSAGQVHYFVARWNGFLVEQLTNSLMPLALSYSLNGDEKYARTAITILDELATIYPTAIEGPLDYPGVRPGFEAGRLERPYYQTARVLLTYASATDLLWESELLDAPSPSNPALSIRDNITYNLLLNGADFCLRQAKSPAYNASLANGVADYNKAILAVGSMFGIDEYIEWAVNGPTSFQIMVSNNIDRDGLYYETTMGYTEYVRKLYLEIADMMFNLRSTRYPQGINYYDDPQFAALYTTSREQLFIAGRSPSYGDTASDAFVGIKQPYDETAAKQIIQFAVRSTDPDLQTRYWQLVAAGTNNFPAISAQDEWGLFNIGVIPATTKPPARTMPKAKVLGASGMALLRSGEDRGALIRYGTTLTHGQKDELSLLLYTHGREMSFDPGYNNSHYRLGWTHQTVSHLAVTVNETSQLAYGGSLDFAAGAAGLSVTQAQNAGVYAHQGVDVYQRLVALVDSTPDRSYALDIFRVKGGQMRDYSFHSWGNQFVTAGLALGAPAPGSLASPEYSWHDQLGVDGAIIEHRSKGFYWQPPPGNGYGFLGNPSSAAGDQPWSASWSQNDRKLKLLMLPALNREIIVADAPSPMHGTKYILARDRGDVPSQYVSVIDMTDSKFQVESLRELAVTTVTAPASASVDFAPVAFSVSLTYAPQVQDIFLASVTGAFQARSDDTHYETDAQFAAVRWESQKLDSLHVVSGTQLVAGKVQVTGFPASYNGAIVAVDYQNGSILVSSSVDIPIGVAGTYLLISAPEYSHNSPYLISHVEPEGALFRIYLTPGTFGLGTGYVAQAPQKNTLVSQAPLAYTYVPSGVSRYYDGKLVVNSQDAAAQIQRVDQRSTLIVDSTSGFAAGDNLTIYDIKTGDAFTIPVAVHITKVNELTYMLTSPQPIWLSVADKEDAYAYVTDSAGEFVPAQAEMRGGVRWFKVPPGQFILQRAGRFVGEATQMMSDANTPRLAVQLEELGTCEPVTGALVTTTLADQVLKLDEITPGVYQLQIPEAIMAGAYHLEFLAHKAELAFAPYEMYLELQPTWHFRAPDVVKVNLGDPVEFDIELVDLATTSAKVEVLLDGQPLNAVPTSSSRFAVQTPALNVEQRVVVQVSKYGGFSQQSQVLLQPQGGRIVPLATQIQAKAGQAVELQVQFMAADGTLLKGTDIPYAQGFAGFMTSDVFTDHDGDGIATAKIAQLWPGTNTVAIVADGCPVVEITIMVAP